MMINVSFRIGAMLLAACACTARCAAQAVAPRADLVEKVARGELRKARASWWGFDPSDSTRYLQAALDSGVAELVVDKMPSPWIVTPLRVGKAEGNPKFRIEFEEGARLEAKRGEFRSLGACLFLILNRSNVHLAGHGTVWRMHKEDYWKPPYGKSEWRHALCISGAENITVEGFRFENSGGDGIYIAGGERSPSRNITIRDCVCDGNNRQGISVISVSGLLIENTVMSNTRGTAPQAGIDFEPNSPGQLLENIVMRNCRTESNESAGYDFFLQQLDSSSRPISIRLENCVSVGDKVGVNFTLALARESTDMPKGKVRMDGCRFEKARYSAMHVRGKPGGTVAIKMDNCSMVDNGTAASGTNDVRVTSLKGYEKPTDGIHFGNLTIRQPVERQWFGAVSSETPTADVEEMSGRVSITGPDGKVRHETLDGDWLRRMFPPGKVCEATLPPVKPDFSRTAPAATSGMSSLARFAVRGTAKYLLRVETAGATVELGYDLHPYGKSPAPAPIDARVTGYETGDCVMVGRLAPSSDGKMSFKVPVPGFYMLEVSPGRKSSFTLAASDTPVALLHDGSMPSLLAPSGRMTFYVGKGERFSVQARGGIKGRAHAVLSDPEGKVVWDRDGISSLDRYQVAAPDRGGFWTLELCKPAKGTYGGVGIGLTGVPGVLFLSDDKRWITEM